MVVGQRGHQHLSWDGVSGFAAVQLLDQPLDEVARRPVLDPIHHVAALTTDSSPADVEDLHGGLQRIFGQCDDVGVGRVTKDDRVLLHGPGERSDVVTQSRGTFEVLLVRGCPHLALQAAHVRRGVAVHERAEVLHDGPVLSGADASNTRCRALADVAEQARPAHLAGSAKDTRAAGACGKDPEQQVQRLADRPRVRVGPVVANPLAFGAAHHLQPRVVLVHGDGQARVALVVAVLDVEPRVELLDPGILELKSLHLVRDDGPVDRRRGGDHGLGPRVQRGQILEVRAQPGAQALGLADIDDPPLRVLEPVDPGRVRIDPGSAGRTTDQPPSETTTLNRRVAEATGPQSETVTSEPDTVAVSGVSPRGAGPPSRAPSAALNVDPWQGQLMTSSATLSTVHDWCGQMALKALKSPATGWVTTTLSAMTPPWSGTESVDTVTGASAVAPFEGVDSPPHALSRGRATAAGPRRRRAARSCGRAVPRVSSSRCFRPTWPWSAGVG